MKLWMFWEKNKTILKTWDDFCKHHHQVRYPSDASWMSCGGVDVPLEPLTDLMRSPAFPCERKWPAALYFDYLWFEYAKPRPPGSKAFYFDLGCSLWTGGGPGETELGQSHLAWVATTYMERGVQWDRIVGWEALTHTREEICKGVPADVAKKFTYFNVGVSDDTRSERWPWKHLLSHTEPGDFVVVKLDIDNAPIENNLMQQIFENPSIRERIDVLFWEQHWSRGTASMRLGCARDGDIPSAAFTPNQTWENPAFWQDPICIHPGGFHHGARQTMLTDLYRNFTAMREMGILAHSWF